MTRCVLAMVLAWASTAAGQEREGPDDAPTPERPDAADVSGDSGAAGRSAVEDVASSEASRACEAALCVWIAGDDDDRSAVAAHAPAGAEVRALPAELEQAPTELLRSRFPGRALVLIATSVPVRLVALDDAGGSLTRTVDRPDDPEAAREVFALVVREFCDALASGARLGFRETAPELPPPPPAEPPLALALAVDARALSTLEGVESDGSRSATRVRLGRGPAFDLGLELARRVRLSLGWAWSPTLHVREDDVRLQLDRHRVRLRVDVVLHRARGELAFGLGGYADHLRRRTEAFVGASAPTSRRWTGGGSLALGGALALSSAWHLVGELGVELAAIALRFRVSGDPSVLYAPWRARPYAELGLRLRFGATRLPESTTVTQRE